MARFTVGEQVKALRDTRFGVMAATKYNVGRIGEIVDAMRVGNEVSYAVHFSGPEGLDNVDWIDEVALERFHTH